MTALWLVPLCALAFVGLCAIVGLVIAYLQGRSYKRAADRVLRDAWAAIREKEAQA